MNSHKAKKISAGNYEYRGFRIEKVDGFEEFTLWNILENDCCNDSAGTLRGAKYIIDQIIRNSQDFA
jgi:hypothetical protein